MKIDRLALALFLPLAGCSSQPGASTTGAPTGAGGAGAEGPTYYRDIKPLVDVKCTGCHVEGGIAPFPLTTYAEVSANATSIVGAVSSRLMPPWPPDDSCTSYAYDRSLSPAQIDALTGWIRAGAPAGDPSEAPVTVADTRSKLSHVDLTLSMPAPYTPKISPDEYRCFLVDWPESDTTYVTGLGVEPGMPAIVHHVIAFLAPPDQVAEYQALDDADPALGWSCFGGPGGTGVPGWLGAWAPGATGADFPKGTGIQIAPGSKVVIQVHYNTLTTKPGPDQTRILIETAKSVDKQAVMFPFANPSWVQDKMMDIPAYAMDATHDFAVDPTPYMDLLTQNVLAADKPFTLYSAALHMHTRGTHAVTRIDRAGGQKECMLQIDDWNFHWQGGYDFSQPKEFDPGDQLYLECHWNNTTPMDVNWGETTEDEMCLGVYYATQ